MTWVRWQNTCGWSVGSLRRGGETSHFENFEPKHFWVILHRGANFFSEIFCESSQIELWELLAESPPTQRCELIFGTFLRKFYYRTFFEAFLVESSEIELLGKIAPEQKILLRKCAVPPPIMTTYFSIVHDSRYCETTLLTDTTPQGPRSMFNHTVYVDS